MTWRCVVMVPHEYVIDYARDVPTAQAGAESIRSKFQNVVVGEETYYPKIMGVYGPKIPIEVYADQVGPKKPPTPQLTVDREPPNDQPPAA